MSKKTTCPTCKGKQIVKGEVEDKPCPALSVTVLGRLACKLPDGTFDNKAEHRSILNARMQKEKAYRERDFAIALFARLCHEAGNKVGVKMITDKTWSREWTLCVVVELPALYPAEFNGGPPVEFIRLKAKNPDKGTEKGRFKVSECDKDLLELEWNDSHNKGPNGTSYWVRGSNKPEPNGFLHRVVAKRIWGEIPEGYEVDHINGDRADCTRYNLRLATRLANIMNIGGVSGVYENQLGNWKIQIRAGDFVYRKTFKTKEEARTAYLEKRREYQIEAAKRGEYIYPPITVSWHIHENNADLFDWMPLYEGSPELHDNVTKYELLKAFRPELCLHCGDIVSSAEEKQHMETKHSDVFTRSPHQKEFKPR